MFSAEDAMFWRLAILAVGAGLLFGAPWLHRVLDSACSTQGGPGNAGGPVL